MRTAEALIIKGKDQGSLSPDDLVKAFPVIGNDPDDLFRVSATFREMVTDCEDRIHVVVRFLALLELYREGKVEMQQAATFGEIEIEWRG